MEITTSIKGKPCAKGSSDAILFARIRERKDGQGTTQLKGPRSESRESYTPLFIAQGNTEPIHTQKTVDIKFKTSWNMHRFVPFCHFRQ